MPTLLPRLVALLLVSLVAVPAGAGRATTRSAAARAEKLFQEARRLMEDGRFAEACPLLAESQQLDPAGGTLLNLAVCHEEEGRAATAWVELHAALEQARREGRSDREEFAQRRIRLLEPRLSRLTVAVAAGSDRTGLVVRRDAEFLDAAMIGVAVPVDVGPHAVEASGPGRRPWRVVVHVKPGQQLTVTIPAPDGERPPPPPARGSRRLAALIVGGSGLALLIVGAAYGIRALDLSKDVERHCPGDVCDARGLSLNHEAKTAAIVADVGIAIGLVAVGLGTWLYLSGRAAREPSPGRAARARDRRLMLAPSPLAGGGAVVLRGAF